MRVRLLIGLDRDGTLIRNDGYFAKDDNWRKKLKVNEAVIKFLLFLQDRYSITIIVLTNQSAVARGYFAESRVTEVNVVLNEMLKKRGIRIDNWQYCPDVDLDYARKHPEVNWNKRYVKKTTRRKPSPQMLFDGLKELGKTLSDFEKIVIIGDHKDDQNLAKKIHAQFLDVTEPLVKSL